MGTTCSIRCHQTLPLALGSMPPDYPLLPRRHNYAYIIIMLTNMIIIFCRLYNPRPINKYLSSIQLWKALNHSCKYILASISNTDLPESESDCRIRPLTGYLQHSSVKEVSLFGGHHNMEMWRTQKDILLWIGPDIFRLILMSISSSTCIPAECHKTSCMHYV